uniref:Uncharacterized protein n=1 Tax=Oryza meridionalis TaxID=40149 RepID=A0A0E0EST7_9ORYZ
MARDDAATAASSLSRHAPCPRCSSPWRPQVTSPSASPSRGLAPPAAAGMRCGKGGEDLPHGDGRHDDGDVLALPVPSLPSPDVEGGGGVCSALSGLRPSS